MSDSDKMKRYNLHLPIIWINHIKAIITKAKDHKDFSSYYNNISVSDLIRKAVAIHFGLDERCSHYISEDAMTIIEKTIKKAKLK